MNSFFSFLGLVKRSRKLLEGYSKCNEGKRREKIYLMIISNDASDSSKRKFINYCNINKIPYIQNFSKEELGSAVGRDEIKILGIIDQNMGQKLIALYEEEENMQ